MVIIIVTVNNGYCHRNCQLQAVDHIGNKNRCLRRAFVIVMRYPIQLCFGRSLLLMRWPFSQQRNSPFNYDWMSGIVALEVRPFKGNFQDGSDLRCFYFSVFKIEVIVFRNIMVDCWHTKVVIACYIHGVPYILYIIYNTTYLTTCTLE